MSNYYQSQKQFNGSQNDIYSAIKYAIRRITKLDVLWTENKVRLRIPISFWSWGESVIIDWQENGVININSECIWHWQIIDWGKNRQNTESIFDFIEEYFEFKAIITCTD